MGEGLAKCQRYYISLSNLDSQIQIVLSNSINVNLKFWNPVNLMQMYLWFWIYQRYGKPYIQWVYVYLNRSNNSILYMISLFQILAQRIFARGRINWLFPRVTLKIHDQIYHKNPRILEQNIEYYCYLNFYKKKKKTECNSRILDIAGHSITYMMRFALHTLEYLVDILIVPSCMRILSEVWKMYKINHITYMHIGVE